VAGEFVAQILIPHDTATRVYFAPESAVAANDRVVFIPLSYTAAHAGDECDLRQVFPTGSIHHADHGGSVEADETDALFVTVRLLACSHGDSDPDVPTDDRSECDDASSTYKMCYARKWLLTDGFTGSYDYTFVKDNVVLVRPTTFSSPSDPPHPPAPQSPPVVSIEISIATSIEISVVSAPCGDALAATVNGSLVFLYLNRDFQGADIASDLYPLVEARAVTGPAQVVDGVVHVGAKPVHTFAHGGSIGDGAGGRWYAVAGDGSEYSCHPGSPPSDPPAAPPSLPLPSPVSPPPKMVQVYCSDQVPDAGCTCGALGKVSVSQLECSAYATSTGASMVHLFDDTDVPEGCIVDIREGEVISFKHVLSTPGPVAGSANARPVCWNADRELPASPPTPGIPPPVSSQPGALPPSEIAVGVVAFGGVALLGFAVCALLARVAGKDNAHIVVARKRAFSS